MIAALAITLGSAFAIYVAGQLLERLHRLGGYAPQTIFLLTAMIVLPILCCASALALALNRRKSPWPELALIATVPAQLLAFGLHLK